MNSQENESTFTTPVRSSSVAPKHIQTAESLGKQCRLPGPLCLTQQVWAGGPLGEPAFLTKFPSDTEAAGPVAILLGGPLLRQPLVPSLGGTQESLVDILIMYESWNPSPSPPLRF